MELNVWQFLTNILKLNLSTRPHVLNSQWPILEIEPDHIFVMQILCFNAK